MEHQVQIEVRYAESDQMGVVYHANYFIWFEIGRTTLFRDAGLDYRKLEEEGIFLPVIEVQNRYHQPAKYGQIVTLKTTVQREKKTQIRFEYQCFHQDTLLCTGFSRHVFMNQVGKAIRFPSQFEDFFKKL
ncbi:MAG: acyl-CoA thioester hydrolase [bacterium]|jgi:acyl-CoA thioester hydrolase